MISHVRPIHARITFWVLLLGENLQLPFLAYHIFCFTFIAIVLYSVLKVPDLVPFGTKSQIPSSRSERPSFRLTSKPTVFASLYEAIGRISPSDRSFGCALRRPLERRNAVVGSNGLEPSTSRLSGARSNHLSYEPMSVASRSASSHPCL